MTNRKILTLLKVGMWLNLVGFVLNTVLFIALDAGAAFGILGLLNGLLAYGCALHIEREFWRE